MPQYASWSAPTDYDFDYAPGKTVRLRPVGPEDLISSGALKYIDTLTALVNDTHIAPAQDKRRVPQDRNVKQLTRAEREAQERAEGAATMKRLSENPQDFNRLLFAIDAALVAGVLEPAIASAYETGTTIDEFEKKPMSGRVSGLVYTDYIPFNDRMVIFNELIKGLGDMKSLPDGSESDLGVLEAIPVDADSPEPTVLPD